MAQWFVEASGQIEGPFTTEAVQSRLHAGTFSTGDRIWGRAMDEWRTLSWWQMSLKELSQHETRIANPEVWHYAFSGSTHGPLSWHDMVNALKSVRGTSMDQLIQVLVWTKGMKEWVSIMEFHEVLEALGVNKRDSARADISGKAVIKALGNTYISPLRHVGEGGFGCEPVPGLMSGEQVTVELQSDDFKTSLHAKAEVRYITDRLAGFKFTQLNPESRGLIVQHVRKSSGAQKFFVKDAA